LFGAGNVTSSGNQHRPSIPQQPQFLLQAPIPAALAAIRSVSASSTGSENILLAKNAEEFM